MTQLNWHQSHWYFGKENRKRVVCLVYVGLSVVCEDNVNLHEAKHLFRGFGIS